MHEPSTAVVVEASPAREHVVQKGETLIKILKGEYPEAYATAYPKVKSFFLKANPSIKDEHMVFEGRKLAVPALPADMFEPAGSRKAVGGCGAPDARGRAGRG